MNCRIVRLIEISNADSDSTKSIRNEIASKSAPRSFSATANFSSPSATRSRTSAGFGNFPAASASRAKPFEQCLVREIREELGVEISVGELFEEISHAYPEKSVRLKFFICKLIVRRAAAAGLRGVQVDWKNRNWPITNFPPPTRDCWRNCAPTTSRKASSTTCRKLFSPGLTMANLALGIFHRIARVRGVDRDVRAEFAADGAGRRLGRIGRAEHVADFADGVHAFINQRDALLRAGLLPFRLRFELRTARGRS